MNKKCNDDLDIRIIRLSKCHIPKNSTILANQPKANQYLAIGYFDMVDAIKVKTSKDSHPLFAAYKNSYRWAENIELLMKEYSTQELIVFTNIGEDGFEEQQIERFWSSDFDIRFISMIHVDNEIAEDNSQKLSRIIDTINLLFKGKEYLYYYSFDYSGIVLLANDMKITDYLSNLFYLNYKLDSKINLIRDSFSLCGINRQLIEEYSKLGNQEDNVQEILFDKDYWKETYTVVTNIGISDYTKYNSLKNELELRSKGMTFNNYGLLGRQDVSIVNSEADLKWLLIVQWLLDKYTSSNDESFYSYETFIKVNISNIHQMITAQNYNVMDSKLNDTNNTDEIYQIAEKALSNRYTTLKEKFDMYVKDQDGSATNKTKKVQYNGEYLAPLKAVKYSILSILRNGFAEDFVICMYQSFLEFLDYLIEKVSDDEDDLEAFDNTFNEYFRSLNSLVNSAMHSERQFVQATAFNAIIYDIPSKVMALYVAIIEDMKQIVADEKDKRYTFLLTPSFSNEISVNVISYGKEKPPHDRILRVSINEQTLYSPNAVIRRMAHEVAHYVGDNLRCREKRKKQILVSVVHLLLYHLIPKCLYNEMRGELIEEISNYLIKDRFPLHENNYSKSLNNLAGEVLGYFYSRNEIKKFIQNHIIKSIHILNNGNDDEKKKFIDYFLQVIKNSNGEESSIFRRILNERCFTEIEIEILSNIIVSDIYAEINILHIHNNLSYLPYVYEVLPSSISEMGEGFLEKISLSLYTSKLVSVYSETFADMQMILLLNLTYKQYIIGFVCEEDIDIERFELNFEDSMRICVVTKLMEEVGFWNIPTGEGCFDDYVDEDKRKQLNIFHNKVQQQIQIVRNTFDTDDEFSVLDRLKDSVQKFKENTHCKLEKKTEKLNNNSNCYMKDLLFSPLWLMLEVYLMSCLQKSIEHYNEKCDEIIKLRETVSIIEDCKDINKVFCTICKEISKYKRHLFS